MPSWKTVSTHDLEGYWLKLGPHKNFSISNQALTKMALKGSPANFLDKFKILQLTFQVVRKRNTTDCTGSYELMVR